MVNGSAQPPKRLERLGLASVLLLAAWLRVWRVQANGFGNEYYSAAVRSMLQSAHNFFFVSFDPAGWVTVDKPPLALWIQALSAKVFGFGSLSILLPQAAEGVAGVAVLYALVRRRGDAAAALTAALALALTPVCVAVDRYNNVDACLVLVLLLAAWALGRAVERGAWAWLLASAVGLGLGFNTKMLAAFTVLPAFFLTFALAAPGSAWSRARKLAAAGLVLALVALSWMATVDLTPAARRPYVGSTRNNSMLELSLGWNGLQRFSGRRRPAAEAGAHAAAGEAALERALAARRRAGGFRGGMGAGEPGPLRLAQPMMAGQVLWFLPLALLGIVSAFRRGKRGGDSGQGAEGGGQGRRAETPAGIPGRIRDAFADRPDRQALLLWTLWLFVCGAVLSALRVMHPYYLVLLAPPMAALCGIGLRALWLEHRAGRRHPLSVALMLTALWQAATLARTPDWSGALLPWLAGGAALGAWLLGRRTPKNAGVPASPAPGGSGAAGTRARVGFTLGFAALLLCPVAWALSPVLAPDGDHAVQADPALLTGSTQAGGRMGARAAGPDRRLLAFLEGHRGTARYLVAADNSRTVGPIIIASGEPAIAVGGFMGSDPIVTVDRFAGLVQSGALRYFLLNPARAARQGRRGGLPNAGAWGRGGRAQALDEWVRKHGSPVPAALWKTPEPEPLYQPAAARGGFFGRDQALLLYDLDAAPRPGHRTGKRKW